MSYASLRPVRVSPHLKSGFMATEFIYRGGPEQESWLLMKTIPLLSITYRFGRKTVTFPSFIMYFFDPSGAVFSHAVGVFLKSMFAESGLTETTLGPAAPF